MRSTSRVFRLAGVAFPLPLRPLAVLCAASATLLSACGGGSDSTKPKVRVPTTVAAEGWQSVTGTAGHASSIAPAVLVKDQDGAALSGVTVTFAVTAGGGSVGTASATTNASGIATAGSWTFGTSAGSQNVRATVASLPPVDFAATVNAGPPANVVAQEGAAQSAPVGSAVTTIPAARVSDQYGNPVSGVAVTFAVTAGGGSVSGAAATTGADGRARPTGWTLGQTLGANTLTATVNGIGTPAVFTTTATAGPPTALLVEAGNAQTGTVGTPVAVPPRVRLEDAYHNPVAGATIGFAVTNGGGSAAGASVATDAQGSAAVGSWTLGTVAGANSLRASLGGGSLTADFTATANPDVPATVTLVEGPSGGVPVATVVAPSPAVRVSDKYANAIASVQVTFTPGANNGTIAQPASTTGADGIARAADWTLGIVAGSQSLTARVNATVALRIDITSVAGPPAQMFLERGGDQMDRVNATLPIAPAVSVYDQYMNRVVGQVVTFTAEPGSGTLAGATPSTNAQGVAQVGSWTLGVTEGVQRVDVSAGGIGGSIAARAVPVSSYNIVLRYLTPATTTQQQAFAAAVGRWSKVIIGDIPDVPTSLSANACGENEPALNETIDDVIIYVVLDSIDGPGKVLGAAGPCYVRSATLLPTIGVMHFDTADVAQLESSGQLDDVILHEMGHVLGVGSLWPYFGYVSGAGTSDPYYTGTNGRAGWSLVGGDAYGGTPVPVENIGGAGTADMHWRNSVLGTELMTGYAEQGLTLPLSLVTVGAMADLGYSITPYGYDVYQYGVGLARAVPGVSRQLREAPLPRTPIALDAAGRPVAGPLGARAAPPAGIADRVRRAMPSLAPSPRDLKKRPSRRGRT